MIGIQKITHLWRSFTAFESLPLWCGHLFAMKPWCLVTTDGAKLIVRPDSSTVPVDTRVSFFCRADGNPMPPVVWRRNGQAISDPRWDNTSFPSSAASQLAFAPSLMMSYHAQETYDLRAFFWVCERRYSLFGCKSQTKMLSCKNFQF